MILPALIDYYGRLDADPNQDVAPIGFRRQGIHWRLVLTAEGELAAIESLLVEKIIPAKRKGAEPKVVRRPQQIVLPDRGERAGTLIKPFFLWDNTGYVLGRDTKGKPERAEQCFEAFRAFHRSFAERVTDPGLTAVVRFLEAWSPEQAESLDHWDEIAGGNCVFRIRGVDSNVHDAPGIQAEWLRFIEEEDDSLPGFSLTTGEPARLARLHPDLKGVSGAQTAGAKIVSFNKAAFESYGKSQSYNAPVSVEDAFRYSTALNRLLADRERRALIGDATVVFWSGAPSPVERYFGVVIREDRAENPATISEVKGFLAALGSGRQHEGLGDPTIPFYILGLSPNQSRLSVRYWCVSTAGELAERLGRHVRDLEMVGARDGDPPLFISRIVRETGREAKDVPPLLAGEVTRSVLTGAPYPAALLSAILRRIRADQTVNHARAAALKAYLIRNHNQEVPVSLNKDHPSPAYHLGRLFAAIEKTQEDSLGGKLNRTVRDSYFGSASATPASVFPRLLRLHQHHLDKLEHEGHRVNRDREVQEMISHTDRFPPLLSLEDQGLFQIGYYHQRRSFFTKKTADQTEEVTA